jgi:hypothetical protein
MVMNFPRYTTPPRNMVQDVRNIVEAYDMGSLRALAQDPVQNAYDARRPGVHGPVRIEYQLHERSQQSAMPMFLLTVKDSNTTGLLGSALSPEDLHRRAEETGSLQLLPEENWAAWEAMGYTKIGEDALGSRGQGKASFLYHSCHPSGLRGPDGHELERMIILYDSLTPDNVYRLGIRLARPEDVVVTPPYEGEEARHIIQGTWDRWEGPPIPLLLEPLSEIGTRVIVPFLSDAAVEALRSGELVKWLERCWWRAIQKDNIEIKVRREPGSFVHVSVPACWREQLWMGRSIPENMYVRRDIRLAVDSPLKIKRIVLLHDSSLLSDEIPDHPTQYSGIQLMRRDQWIETLGATEKFGDFIPRDKRPGFRGFVEFDSRLEKELRREESPQHDKFKRRRIFVKQIDACLRNAVREFAERQGWLGEERRSGEADRVAQEILSTVIDTFLPATLPGVRRRGLALNWACDLELDFPHADSARVEWDEMLRNITVTCRHDPADQRRNITVTLSIIDTNGQQTDMESRSRITTNGTAVVGFPDIAIVRITHGHGQVACQQPGKYRLKAQCTSEGRVVATANRYIYIRTDPPPRNARNYGVDISVHNASADRIRVNHGEAINVAITVSNRTSESAELALTASFGPLLLADSLRVSLPGRPEGDAPSSRMLHYTNIGIFTSAPAETPSGLFVLLEPGRHTIDADVYDSGGQVVAHATRAVYVETEPEDGGAGLPFDVRPRETTGRHYPVWELEPPAGSVRDWILWYAREHPTYVAAVAADRSRPEGTWLYGSKHFWAETYCTALVEWALALYRDQGDQGGFKLFTDRTQVEEDQLWEKYQTKVEELMSTYGDPLKCLAMQREVVSLMLYLLRRG